MNDAARHRLLPRTGAAAVSRAACAIGMAFAASAMAESLDPAASTAPARPRISLIRYEEDWSALADPSLRTEAFDALKHIGVGNDPERFLSLGANARGRYEVRNAFLFGVPPYRDDSYFLWRTQLHADLRLGGGWQVFAQVEDVGAEGLRDASPADRNKLDLRQAFVSGFERATTRRPTGPKTSSGSSSPPVKTPAGAGR